MLYTKLTNQNLNRDTPELRIFWVFPANPGVQINFTVKMLAIVQINRSLYHREAITVNVCLYPWISWEKPTFTEFRITSITDQKMIIFNLFLVTVTLT